jgi:hypothetical protein
MTRRTASVSPCHEEATKKGMASYAERVATMDWLEKVGEVDGDSAMGDIGEEGPSTSGRGFTVNKHSTDVK